ncbi:MAG: sulfite exporter TauE/SafE family protein [Pseudomonadota bacterium]
MDAVVAEYGLVALAASIAVMATAGFVKGTVGFALPMIVVSGVGSLTSAETAIVAILLPSLVTNLMQAFREGLGEAALTLRRYWRLNLILFALIGLVAQLVVVLPEWALFAILGTMVVTFGLLQLAGWRPTIPLVARVRAQWVAGGMAGVFGGLAGVWGPPILMYFLACNTPKKEQVRAQGISFLIGSLVLIGAHMASGLLNRDSAVFSAAMVLPAVIGMAVGQAVQDRLNQALFRKLTLTVLALAGLNLLRRAVFG